MTYNRRVQQSQVQWIAGTVATPLGVAAYRVADLSKYPEQSVPIESDDLVGIDQPGHTRPGGRFGALDFSAKITDSPVDDAPYVGALFRACGMKELTGGTTPNIAFIYTLGRSTAYLSDTPAGYVDPIDLVINQDRLKRTLLNCVGEAEVVFKAGTLPFVMFNFRGETDSGAATATTSSATEVALGALTVADTVVATMNEALSIKIGAAGAVTDVHSPEIRVKFGNEIFNNDSVDGVFGFGAPAISGRKPNLKLNVLMRELTNYNFENAFLGEELLEITWNHNSGGGVGGSIKCGFRGHLNKMPEPVERDGMFDYALDLDQSEVIGDEFFMGWESTADHSYPFP